MSRTCMPLEILVVDDEPDLALLIRQKFRKRIRSGEWAFHFAHNGVEALESIEQHPDILVMLTDINMPEMDGLTLLDHISHLDRLLKAVVVSAYGDMDNIRTAMNRGAFDFITKPVDFQDLEVTVEKTLKEVISFKEALESQIQLSALQRELAAARRIQQAFIPESQLIEERFAIKAHIEMAYEVGGDFYDFFMLDERRLGIAVGDVSGKGVSAAIFMAITRTMLRTIAQKGGSPEETISEVNKLLHPQSLPEVFVTVIYGILDLNSGQFSYVTAGHFAPYVLKPAANMLLLDRTRGIGLCMMKDFEYQSGATQLAPGESLFFFSDGIPEATRIDGEQFSQEALSQLLQDQTAHSPADIVTSTLDAIREFTEGAPQSDDITILALTFKG